jgi:hypothetical protein
MADRRAVARGAGLHLLRGVQRASSGHPVIREIRSPRNDAESVSVRRPGGDILRPSEIVDLVREGEPIRRAPQQMWRVSLCAPPTAPDNTTGSCCVGTPFVHGMGHVGGSGGGTCGSVGPAGSIVSDNEISAGQSAFGQPLVCGRMGTTML